MINCAVTVRKLRWRHFLYYKEGGLWRAWLKPKFCPPFYYNINMVNIPYSQ